MNHETKNFSLSNKTQNPLRSLTTQLYETQFNETQFDETQFYETHLYLLCAQFIALYLLCIQFIALYLLCTQSIALYFLYEQFIPSYSLCAHFSAWQSLCAQFIALYSLCTHFIAFYFLYEQFIVWCVWQIAHHQYITYLNFPRYTLKNPQRALPQSKARTTSQLCFVFNRVHSSYRYVNYI